jgi:hypothetical protein
MSLLHQDSRQGSSDQLDDAARGESFTRGTSPIVLASIIATLIVGALIAAYIIADHQPPDASGQVLEVWARPMRTTTPAFDANGAPIPPQANEHVLVFTRVRLHNRGKNPLFLAHVMANATLADGVHSSYAAPASEYNRVFQAYPELDQWHAPALDTEATIPPGQSVEGTFVTSFSMSKAQWDARKSLDFTFGFQYQPPLTLSPTAPVIQR